MTKQFFCLNSRDSRATLYDFPSIRVYSWLESSQRHFSAFSGNRHGRRTDSAAGRNCSACAGQFAASQSVRAALANTARNLNR
jgi:hypothetical protein